MQYFALETICNIDLALVVRRTLQKMKKKKFRHSMTLCIYVEEATDDNIEKLKTMIDSKKLLKNYTINRQYDRFYLQWK
jgi:hypothetical protein